MGIIANRFKKQLEQLKIESDKNDKLIAESFELLSTAKQQLDELDSLAKQICNEF